MKTLLVVFVLVLCGVCLAKEITQEAAQIVKSVNSNPKALWKAEHNHFSYFSDEELRQFLGVMPDKSEIAEKKFINPSSNAPDEFDARVAWKDCITPIQNQGRCGSCWAFAATGPLSDRFCIQSNGTVKVVLSAQDLVSCDIGNLDCKGGWPNKAWMWIKSKGIVSESCFPYSSFDGSVPPCAKNCSDTGKPVSQDKYYAKKWHQIFSPFKAPELSMREEIIKGGPIEVTMVVYKDFFQYKSGVYHHTVATIVGRHAVKVVGWGVDKSQKDTPYWIVANSWGTNWGQEGYFWILRGKFESNIEREIYTVTPDLENVPKH